MEQYRDLSVNERLQRNQERYSQYIAASIKGSKIYVNCDDDSPRPKYGACSVRLIPCGTSDALKYVNNNSKVCLLNFASFKNPGGGFLAGMMAQEEALCFDSTLYNVLASFQDTYYANNKLHLNHGIYLDRAIYSPRIMFDVNNNGENVVVPADVLTCACPNWGAALRNGVKMEDNIKAIRSRMIFMAKTLQYEGVDIFVTGAWGCGVFRQDPTTVAKLFKEVFNEYVPAGEVVFAIPNEAGRNYQAFKQALGI